MNPAEAASHPRGPLSTAAHGAFVGTWAGLALAMLESAAAALAGAPWPTPGRLLGGTIVASVVGGAFGALVSLGLGLARGKPGRSARTAAGAMAALLVGVGLATLLTTGPRASVHRLRWPLVLLAGVLGSIPAALLLWWWHDIVGYLRARRTWTAATSAGIAATLVGLDTHWLPGLYPALHWSLRALALAILGLGAWVVIEAGADRRHRAMSLALAGVLGVTLIATGAVQTVGTNIPSPTLPPTSLWLLDALEPPEPAPAAAALPTEAPATPNADTSRLDLLGCDVFLITVDALRTDHVGFSEGRYGLTPGLDRLAADAVVAERMYTPAPHSSYALASMFSGHYLYPRIRAAPNAARDATLAEWMHQLGYRTVALYNPGIWHVEGDRLGAHRDARLGFDEVIIDYGSADRRRARVLEKVRSGSRRLFLWAHLGEPHEPYDEHDAVASPPPPPPGAAPPHAGYASEIRYVDLELSALVAELRSLRPGAIIVITSDHGEAFGEHGVYYHGASLFEEEVRIPFAVIAPGLLPRRVGVVLSLVDVWPTLAAMLGVEPPPHLWGRSALGAFLGVDGSTAGTAYFNTHRRARGLVAGARKLICDADDTCALFELGADPAETIDRSADLPTAAAEMRARLERFEAKQIERAGRRTKLDAAAAALARGTLGDDTALPEIRALLADPRTPGSAREQAAYVLRALADTRATDVLRTVAAAPETPVQVRYAAAACAGLLGDPRALPLLDALGPPPPPIDASLYLLARARLGAADSSTPLAELLKHPEREVREDALELLTKARDPATAPALVEALTWWKTRPLAAAALGALGDRRHVPALLEALETEAQVQHRATILGALAALGGAAAEDAILLRVAGAEDTIGAVEALETIGTLPRIARRAKAPLAARAGWRCNVRARICESLEPIATVRITIPKEGARRVILTLEGTTVGGGVRLRVAHGETELATVRLAAGWRDFHITPPAGWKPGKEAELRLEWIEAPEKATGFGAATGFGRLKYALAVK